MIHKNELSDNEIFSYDKFATKLDKPDLLLGNGFTLQFSKQFSYKSLFDIFLKNCKAEYIPLFKSFGTTNFELILDYLNNAVQVNKILGIRTDLIYSSIEQLKNGLILSIEKIHPRTDEIDFETLTEIAYKLESFGDIFTTNYDLFLYHILMLTNDIKQHKKKYISYQDFFWGNQAPYGFKQFMDYQDYPYKNIYYLHGALFIYNNDSNEVKLLRDVTGDELIDMISKEIKKNNFPIFVSEGNAKDKINSIYRSRYLRFCLDKLSNKDNAIVVFGNTLHEIDIHIIDAIKYKPRDIIYCIYIGERTINDVLLEKQKFKAKFDFYRKKINFVDASTVF